MKVVSSAKISTKRQQELKERFPNADFYFFEDMSFATTELKDADILITYGEDLTEEIIDECIKLKWVQIISAGLDKVPFKAFKDRDIIVTNARGIHYIPMAEYTLAMILSLARKTNEIFINQQNKQWDRSIRVSEVYGTTLGIVGLGSIGQGIAKAAKALNMNIIGTNRDGRDVEYADEVYPANRLKEVMQKSDYVVVVVPLTNQTYHLIGEQELNSMNEAAYIINIARGEVINESALIDVLEKKKIAGAVLDVFSQEPLPVDSKLWSLENCIVTPHLSGRSPKYMERALEIFDYNMNLFTQRKVNDMKNIIDLERQY